MVTDAVDLCGADPGFAREGRAPRLFSQYCMEMKKIGPIDGDWVHLVEYYQ